MGYATTCTNYYLGICVFPKVGLEVNLQVGVWTE
jgi:hypothetical protein